MIFKNELEIYKAPFNLIKFKSIILQITNFPQFKLKITNLQENLSPLVKEHKNLIEEIKELESQIKCLNKFNKKIESFDIYQYSEKPQNHFKKCQTCQQWKNCIDSELKQLFILWLKKKEMLYYFK